MSGHSPARLLAPLALAASLAATLVIVAASLGGREVTSDRSPPSAARRTAAAVTPRTRTYRIQPGDFLSRIAERSGVSVARLRELNPTVDPTNLRVGQRLTLEP